MPYTVAAVQAHEVSRLAEIQWAALHNNPLIQVLYPRGATAALSSFTTESYKRSFTFPSASLIKATNDATGEIVGFAKWVHYRQDEDQALRQSLSGIRQKSEQSEGASVASRRGSGWVKEKNLMPKMPPDCHGVLLERWGDIINILDILHVIPLYQKAGVGIALINWGVDLADKEGIQCYVESSPAARSLCVKRGFQHLAEIRIELGKYKEGYHDYRHSVMLRPPHGKEEPPKPPSKANPFADEKAVSPRSPVSPVEEDEEEPTYTAEAKLLEFRSSSSLRSAKLMETRTHSRSNKSSQGSIQYQKPPPLPKTPRVA
ncbi:uncharacterized protein KY384_003060 [Bacidia gigantensis]|uniref:uncharacterized protein n=1 Tax=Bacidia gigantensis TaxID=2732470 RepID=UPI001D055ED4|nr:uncharacterized protein KY384_003060 [Bacidia gigantensis]KAG8531431.1 hypothetical protein KY384_003060 [Bacidia gigantensis]